MRSAPSIALGTESPRSGPNESGWDAQTDALKFLRDKDVDVVNPIGGASSYYTDWVREDPVLGVEKWQTFLNDELPPVIEKFLGANGNRTVVGVSMSGTSVLNLAIAKPGFWASVASYSGCAQTSDPIGHEFVRLTVENWGGARSVENMWGPAGGPLWRANDPLVNADRLRGTAIYMSSGSGVPAAPHDTPADRRVAEGRIPLPAQTALGGPIEAAVHFCTMNLADRLHELNIPVTVDDRPVGTHSWGYREDDLHRSRPFLEADRRVAFARCSRPMRSRGPLPAFGGGFARRLRLRWFVFREYRHSRGVNDRAEPEHQRGQQEPAVEERLLVLSGGGEIGRLSLADDSGKEEQEKQSATHRRHANVVEGRHFR